MKKLFYFLIFTTAMFSSSILRAQKRNVYSVDWHIAGNLPKADLQEKNSGLAGTFAGISGKWMWIAGGANFPEALPWDGGKKKYHDVVYFFERVPVPNGNITALSKKTTLPMPLAYGVSIQVGESVICAGGENNNGYSAAVFRLDVNSKDTSLSFEQLPDLPVAVSNASGTFCNGKIFIAGGEMDQGTSDLFFVLDITVAKPAWKKIKNLPAPVSHSTLITQFDGNRKKLYLIGGRTKTASGISLLYEDVYQYDLERDEWKPCTKLPYALSAHVSVAVGKHFILVAGGDKGEVFNRVEKLIGLINTEIDPVIKEKLKQEKNRLQKNHPGFSKEVLVYNTSLALWSKINALPAAAPVTTTALVWGNDIIIPSGEIKAGIRTTQILSGKIVFK